jgi:two-component system chemotaxis sensor kinase CheA
LDDELADILPEFAAETRELLSGIEADLIEIERKRAQGVAIDPDRIHRVFRSFHSIKGNAGFLSLTPIVDVAHASESLLGKVRDGEGDLDADRITALCEALDFVNGALDAAEGGGGLDGHDAGPLTRRLKALLPGPGDGAPAPTPAPAPAPVPVAPVEVATPTPTPPPVAIPTVAAPAPIAAPTVAVAAPTPAPAPVAVAAPTPAPAPAPVAVAAPTPAPAAPTVAAAPESEDDSGAHRPAAAGREESPKEEAKFVRVETQKLDALMNLVGELIIAERMVTNNADLEGLDLPGFENAALQLNRITRGLQDVAMQSRMVPVRGLFRKMGRIVRDIAVRQGKEIHLELSGEETDVDKNVIEQIADPLVHLVRNSCDHGIERPEDRTKAGKDPAGTVRIDARAEAGEVRIVVQDNGKGLDRTRILARAVERGLVPEGRTLSDAEVFNLIFEPGFSTAEALTEISGRGVGMDVVRKNIEALRGRIDIASTPGQGSRFTLSIPLTLAIIEGMLVRVAQETYILPMLSIRESLRGQGEQRVTLPGGGTLLPYRGRLIPIVRLEDTLGLATGGSESELLLVVGDERRQVGVVVDEILGQRQTVVKGLPSYLGSVAGVSGCSILTNGEVSLILDVQHLLASAGGEGGDADGFGRSHVAA